MTKVILSIVFSLSMTLKSYAFPYSNQDQIQVYRNIPDSLLSSGAKKCMDASDEQGIMSQLSQNLGCSNFYTAENVCNCVDKLFDKDKIEEFYSSDIMGILNIQMQNTTSLDENALSPEILVMSKLGNLNRSYDEMGIPGCTFGNRDSFFSKFETAYQTKKSKYNKSNTISPEVLNEQHQIFNRELRDIGDKEPSRADLLEISKRVSEESGSPFFLEAKVEVEYDLTNENNIVYQNIQNEIINEYLSFHKSEIENNIKPEDFDLGKASSKIMKKNGRGGCRKLLSYVGEKKEDALNKKILENFTIFFPDSYLGRSSEEDKDIRMQTVESSISELYSSTAMVGAEEHEKDIFYCQKYNLFKERSEKIAKNEPLKLRLAQLEKLKKEDYLSALEDSSASDGKNLDIVNEQIKNLEDKIMLEFSMNKEELGLALIGFNIWKVDKGIDTETDENGKISFVSVDSSKELSITERMNNRSKSIERARNRRNVSNNSTSTFASTFSTEASNDQAIVKKRSLSKVSNSSESEASSSPVQSSNSQNDNYFNQIRSGSSFNVNSNTLSKSNNSDEANSLIKDERGSSERDVLDSYISNRINKLKEDKITTEKQLSDELASTKESLELAKLREELRKQSEEIEKLTKSKEESSAIVDTTSPNVASAPVSFKSPLASALDKTFIDNTSDEAVGRQAETANTNRNTASSAGYTPGVEQAASTSAGATPSGSSSSGPSSSSEESSSVSGISLSSLKSIGDDVQVMDNSVLGEIRPIVVDESFAELSEDEKREKIEELLETTAEEEVYIEFPDGKVLKFSKKDELNKIKKPKVKAKKAEVAKKRETFSYDKLKEIIDNTKE